MNDITFAIILSYLSPAESKPDQDSRVNRDARSPSPSYCLSFFRTHDI